MNTQQACSNSSSAVESTGSVHTPTSGALSSTHLTPEVYAARRKRLLDALEPTTAAVFFAPSVALRNGDSEFDYRQESDVLYLTGFDEPDSVLVLGPRASLPGEGNQQRAVPYVLFVRPRDPERETWDGLRAGVEGAKESFGADEAFPVAQLDKELPRLLLGHDSVVYHFGHESSDARLFGAIAAARRLGRKERRLVPTRIVHPTEVLHEHRLRKAPEELAVIRRACAITHEAHCRAMRLAAPGRYEFELEAEIGHAFRRGGGVPAYGTIVGSGPNATILHHRRNDRRMNEGELVLIDAGCEHEGYASDVTRTFPVDGRFRPDQQAVYEVVLEAQLAAIDAVKPGATLVAIHDVAVRVLTEGLVRLGILEGSVDELIGRKAYEPYYMHQTSHWLGMDVHDVGRYFVVPSGADRADKVDARPLESGMVLTIEPGLYFGTAAKPPERWAGIGVRIEDDVLVTDSGCEVLTAGIPKTVDEVHRACRE